MLKLHIISLTSKLVKKVIKNFGSSKAFDPHCIPVVVLKNCDLELSYILAELFNTYLSESCFPDCWKVISVSLYLRMLGERSTPKTTVLSVVSKIFKKLVSNRLADHLKKVVFCLKELLGLLIGLGLLELLHLIYGNHPWKL